MAWLPMLSCLLAVGVITNTYGRSEPVRPAPYGENGSPPAPHLPDFEFRDSQPKPQIHPAGFTGDSAEDKDKTTEYKETSGEQIEPEERLVRTREDFSDGHGDSYGRHGHSDYVDYHVSVDINSDDSDEMCRRKTEMMKQKMLMLAEKIHTLEGTVVFLFVCLCLKKNNVPVQHMQAI